MRLLNMIDRVGERHLRFGNSGLLRPSEAMALARRSPGTARNAIRDKLLGTQNLPFPRYLDVHLTDRCNFACPMCSIGEGRAMGLELAEQARPQALPILDDKTAAPALNRRDLPFDVFERVVEQSRPFTPYVDFTAGEPLMYGAIEEAIRLLTRHQMLSYLVTNGMFLPQKAGGLAKAGLSVIAISLDGWDEASQALRGNVKGSFQAIKDGVKALYDARGRSVVPVIRIATSITQINHARLHEIQDVVYRLGIKSWILQNYMYATDPIVRAHEQFSRETGIGGPTAMHHIEGDRYQVDLDAYYASKAPSAASVCHLPNIRLDVQVDGSLSLCLYGHTLGNIEAGDTIASVWRGDKRAYFRRLWNERKTLPMCFRCCGLTSGGIRF